MISTRRKPRFTPPAQLEAETRMRKAVRVAVRTFFPDLPKAPGIGWLIAPLPLACPDCDRTLYAVQVPTWEAINLAYCYECELACTLEPEPPSQ